ncbi:Synapse-associated protein 1 [Cichlidogyrus casuarinus]|uniref:Synapse-associated protein 1 n=1 Tax=Cichlidogyrus casuarinus TaxID=1844966 RepID=A0ABD2QKQ4_9PLAT
MFGNMLNILPFGNKSIPNGSETNETDDIPAKEANSTLSKASDLGNLFYTRILESSKQAYEQVNTKVKEMSSNLPSDLLEKHYQIFDEFNKCQNEFKNSQEQSLEDLAKLAPWDSAVTGLSSAHTTQLKNQVLNLSNDERNFVRPIPDDANFDWSPERSRLHLITAVKVLELDPKLSALRFKLVPKKLSEDCFWKNYFYRISLIRQTIQLSELAGTSISDSIDQVVVPKDELLAKEMRNNDLADPLKGARGTVPEPVAASNQSAGSFHSDSIKSIEDDIEEELLREIDEEANNLADDDEMSEDEELQAELAEIEKHEKPGQ